MKKPCRDLFILVLLSLITSCVHSSFHGSVTEFVSDTQAQVHISDGLPKNGEKVEFYEIRCRKSGGGADRSIDICQTHILGKAVVVEHINDHDAIVEFEVGLKIGLGTYVKRIP